MTKKITDTTEFWVVVIAILVIILLGLAFYWVKYFFTNNYYNYEGNEGEYNIGKSKVGDVIFYHISVFYNDHEYIYSFRNHPKDLEYISLEPNLFTKINRPGSLKTLFVTRDIELANMTNSDSVLAAVSFEQILTGEYAIYDLRLTNTYTTKVRDDLSVIDCNSVNNNIAVIYIKIGEEEKIYSDGDCIIIQGRGGEGLIRASEKFAYYLLGVF